MIRTQDNVNVAQVSWEESVIGVNLVSSTTPKMAARVSPVVYSFVLQSSQLPYVSTEKLPEARCN